jgi:hypothetical protein
MLKKLGIPVMALAALLLLFAPHPAKAEVHFGVYLGAPVYSYPAYPVDPYAYSYAYPYSDYYSYPYAYATPYVAPYYGYSYRSGNNWREHERHEFREHERHEMREHGRRGRR